ncbi:MAG: IPT/TIG domain-containing protein, partial [Armatimonadota bacterium]
GPSPAQPITIADARTVLVGAAGAPPRAGAEPGRALATPWAQNELPHIDQLTPAPKGPGYVPGAILTIVGRNFSPTAQNNGVIIERPDMPNIPITAEAVSAADTRIMFQLPAQLGTGIRTLPVAVGKPGKQGAASSNTVTFQSFTPPGFYNPKIAKVWPNGQKPGQSITIDGEKFVPNSQHALSMRNISLKPEWIHSLVWATVVSPTQLKATIPLEAPAGTYEVQVMSETGTSNTSELRVSPFEYRIVLNEIQCIDETDDFLGYEGGDDDIVTICLVLTDGTAKVKNTGEYHFDDGTIHSYNPGDSMLLDWTPVSQMLVMTMEVWEIDSGDIEQSTKIIGVAGDVAKAIVSGIWGPEAGSTVGKVIAFVGKAWETIAGWLGMDDNERLGPQAKKVWLQPQLARALPQGKDRTEWLDFDRLDGVYRVRYTLSCR